MKNSYLLITITSCLLNVGFAQNLDFEWAKVEGLYEYDYGYGITTDNSGNVYIAGKFEQNAIFSGVTLPNQGNHDIYVAQYSPSGNMNWIRTAGGFNGDYARCITTNRADKVYIAGEVEDGNATIYFPGSSILLYPKGNNDLFIACYDLSGTLQWAMRDGDIDNEKANGIALDPSGNIVVCGYFEDTTKFGNTTTAISKGYHDMLVAKYDANGNFLWMKNAGGPGLDEGRGIVCDQSGNIYVTGVYSDSAVFGSTMYNVANTNYGKFTNGYIAKYDPNGNLLWVKTIGAEYTDAAWSIAIDAAGKLYVTGEFTSGQFTGNDTTWSNGRADMFVACYDQSGSCQWVNKAGGNLVDRGRGVGVSGNTILVTGQVGLTASFGSVSVTAVDSQDVFVAAYDNAGNFLWVKTVGGTQDAFDWNGFESGTAVCGNGDAVYATGALFDNGVFGNTTLTCYAHTDVFLTKLSTQTAENELRPNVSNVLVYPNPATDKLVIGHTGSIRNSIVQIVNALGEIVYAGQLSSTETTINVESYSKGVYTLRVSSSEGILSKKIVIQ